jgi:hypothetical protein
VIDQKTPDWVHSVATGDIDNDGKEEIAVGLVSNCVQVYRLQIQ